MASIFWSLFFFAIGFLIFAKSAKASFAVKFGKNSEKSTNVGGGFLKFVGISFVILSLFIVGSSMFTKVNPKHAGVVHAFGKVSDKTLAPGPHITMPWETVVEIDGTIQTDKYEADNCIEVRIGDGSNACIQMTNRWGIVQEQANHVFQDFRSNDPTKEFSDAVISTELASALQDAFKFYNPIAQVENAGNGNSKEISFAPDYKAIAKAVEDDMKTRLSAKGDPMAEIYSITISYMKLSDSTQKKLDDYIAAVGETRIAEQKKATAKAQADSNRILATSVSKDPNVLVSKCMDILADSTEKGYQMPAGFSCWPGGGGGVVIPATGGNNAQ